MLQLVKLLTTVETEDEVIQLCGALMQYYRETAFMQKELHHG